MSSIRFPVIEAELHNTDTVQICAVYSLNCSIKHSNLAFKAFSFPGLCHRFGIHLEGPHDGTGPCHPTSSQARGHSQQHQLAILGSFGPWPQHVSVKLLVFSSLQPGFKQKNVNP